MQSRQPKPISNTPAIEFLAQEAEVPADEVARIYGKELLKLQDGARVTTYLPIIAFRHVREILHSQTVAK